MIQSSLLNHYNVIDCDNGYCFRADSGNTCYITFIKYPTISDFLSVEIGGGVLILIFIIDWRLLSGCRVWFGRRVGGF